MRQASPVIGTKYEVAKSKGKWVVVAGATPCAGPFWLKAQAVNWAILDEVLG